MYTITMIPNETFPTFDSDIKAVKEIRCDVYAESLVQAIVAAEKVFGGRVIARDAYWNEDE